MAANTFKLLEFGELLSLLGCYIGSPLGKAKLPSLVPCADLEAITTREQLAAEAREYLRSSMGSPGAMGGGGQETGSRTLALHFSGFTDPVPILQKVSVEGTILEIPEIAELLSFASQASDIKRALQAFERRFPHLAGEAARIGNFN